MTFAPSSYTNTRTPRRRKVKTTQQQKLFAAIRRRQTHYYSAYVRLAFDIALGGDMCAAALETARGRKKARDHLVTPPPPPPPPLTGLIIYPLSFARVIFGSQNCPLPSNSFFGAALKYFLWKTGFFAPILSPISSVPPFRVFA